MLPAVLRMMAWRAMSRWCPASARKARCCCISWRSIDPALPVLFLETASISPKRSPIATSWPAARADKSAQPDEPGCGRTLAKKDESGLRWSYDPDGCCEIRKVEPLAKALASTSTPQSPGARLPVEHPRRACRASRSTPVDVQGRLKINPLADWSRRGSPPTWPEHDLPPHPLVAEGYPSIGCSPCTSKVAPGEDPRSGRWKGWDKTECGIHAPTDGKPGDELPPGYDPVF
jgi:phosphoadenosine phosphosulfate reductase